jgi:hypothetical protein
MKYSRDALYLPDKDIVNVDNDHSLSDSCFVYACIPREVEQRVPKHHTIPWNCRFGLAQAACHFLLTSVRDLNKQQNKPIHTIDVISFWPLAYLCSSSQLYFIAFLHSFRFTTNYSHCYKSSWQRSRSHISTTQIQSALYSFQLQRVISKTRCLTL